jgi:hypothetical protein
MVGRMYDTHETEVRFLYRPLEVLMESLKTQLFMFGAMFIGYLTARLHNRGKIWQGNLLFGTFVLGLLIYLTYGIVSAFLMD